MAFEQYMTTADTANMQAGGRSWTDQAADVLTKGVGTAIYSGVASIYNTGVMAANFFGTDVEKLDVAKTLENFDQNWAKYYKENQSVIDTVGFIGTSFIPGGLAIKGLNLARRGEAFGTFGKMLNYSSVQQTASLERALQTIAAKEGSIFTRMNADFAKSIAWGAVDNGIQSLAFETAVAATMAASPLLEGKNAKDFLHDVGINALIGGVAGGAIEGFFANKILKDAVKQVDATGKQYNFRLPEAFEKLNLAPADKAYSYIDAAMAMPSKVFEEDKLLDFVFHLNGRKVTTKLDTAGKFDKELENSVKGAYLEFERHVTTGLSADLTVAKPLAASLLDLIKEGKAAIAASKGTTVELTEDTIRERMFNYLGSLKSVRGATEAGTDDLFDGSIRYFNRGPKGGDFGENFKNLFSRTPVEGLYRVRVAEDVSQLKVSMIGIKGEHQLVKDAWKDGVDLAFKPDGTWVINPASKLIRPAPELATIPMFFNTVTKQTGDKLVATIADIATKQESLAVVGNKVLSGGKSFTFSSDVPLAEGATTLEQTARHLWASKLERISGIVEVNDFSVLDHMSLNKLKVADDTQISLKSSGIDSVDNWKNYGNFDGFVFDNKVRYLQSKFQAGEQDIQKLALEINATPEWVQNVVASGYQTNLKTLTDKAPDLTKGWQRDLTSYGQRENLLLEYARKPGIITDDFGNTVLTRAQIPMTDNLGNHFMGDVGDQFITGIQSYNYRVKLAMEQLDVAFVSTLGRDAEAFLGWDAKGLVGMADRLGAGATLTGSANANYGDGLALFAQETGKQVHLLVEKLSNATLGRIKPLLMELKNDQAAINELVAVRSMVQRSETKFTLLTPEYGVDGVYVVSKAWLKDATPESLATLRDLAKTGNKEAFHINSDLTAQFLKEHMAINATRLEKRKTLLNAQGITSNLQGDTLYFPPIDTRKFPYLAFVKKAEGSIFGDSDVGMITARSAEELAERAASVDPHKYDVIYKKDTERFFKAKGDYDYSRSINESSINSGLGSAGKLGDFMPSFRPEDVLEDFIQYHQRQEAQFVRDAVSTKYAQPFSELERLSSQYTRAATSKAEPIGKFFQRTVTDPFGDYIKTALDISKRSEFTLLHQTNEFVDALGIRAYQGAGSFLNQAHKGDMTWEEANTAMNRLGLSGPFTGQEQFLQSQTVADRNLIKSALNKANMILATVTLRFDMANSLVNIISTPIMLGTEVASIRKSVAADGELSGKLNELLTLKVPGQEAAIPSTTRLIGEAIRNYWGPEKAALLERYKANGDVKDTLAIYHEMVDSMSVGKVLPTKLQENVDKGVELVAKGTFNNFAEQFTRFVSADVMRQITEPLVQAGKMGINEQNAYISTFVNRVQGNYIASQRPILFQGTLGSAVGLFQTYQFNMLQQLFRHVENRDVKTVATLAGLQTGVFGLNGLPLFEAVNTHLVGNANLNPGHKDIYTTVTQAAGKDMGNWLLYGTASAMPFLGGQAPSLYTRGDINPRHVTIIPVSPLDVPAVDGTLRFTKNLLNMGEKLAAGGDVTSTLLAGLEHNSISRPLAGLAQVMQGASTTSKGALISSTTTQAPGISTELRAIAAAGRILGAKPLDESIGLNARFRMKTYEAEDRERVEVLGQIVKDKFRTGKDITEEDYHEFAGKYMAAGGNVQNFSRAVQGWAKDATQSTLNRFGEHQKSSYGQRYMEVMGGTRLPDNLSTPTE